MKRHRWNNAVPILAALTAIAALAWMTQNVGLAQTDSSAIAPNHKAPSATTTLGGHCDTMDGPVVLAAKKSLETGNLNHTLIWVQEDDEQEIERAFEEARHVRALGPEAKQLADRYFFETVVRVHRAGEDAPYTGLKPEGTPADPTVTAADRAIQSGNLQAMLELLSREMREGLTSRFHHVIESKDFGPDDVAAGREFVHAYVQFVHYAENLASAAKAATAHHEVTRE